MRKKKNIILLMGKKGSGKSFAGSLLQKEFNIKFVRVEDWAKKTKRERNIDDEFYLNEVFQVIEDGLRKEVLKNHSVSFESLGLSIQFDKMINNLSKDFNLVTIKLQCDSDQCIERVKKRDQSIHMNISDDQILKINKEVEKRNYQTDFTVNNNLLNRKELIVALEKILKGTSLYQ